MLAGRVLLSAALVVVGCGGGPAPSGAATPPPGTVVVTAQDLAFSPSTVNAPAGQPFVLFFDNRDSAIHNAHLVDAAGQTLVAGELFSGPSTRTADVPALAPGTYKLLCDVHPDMTADLTAS